MKTAKKLQLFACALLAFFASTAMPGYANAKGMSRYKTCIQNASAADATNFTATLVMGGLFFNWSGNLAAINKNNGKCEAKGAALFMGASMAGQNAIVNVAAPVPKDKLMLLDSIRNNTNLDEAVTATTFLRNGVNLTTSFGKAGVTPLGPSGGVILRVVNSGSSDVALVAVEARENNSQDPLDFSRPFNPDGTVVLNQGDYSLAPGQELDFQFSLSSGAQNWSFEITYGDSDGGAWDDVVATDVD